MEFNHRVPTITLYDVGLLVTKESSIFVMLPALTERLIVPRVMVASPESPIIGFGSSAILDGLISILSRVFLKMITVELPGSTNILQQQYSGLSARRQGDRLEV